jgi:2-polyprenyl-6-methoxyphenol hydroxylase-like FAD-dependent oxidoreductase
VRYWPDLSRDGAVETSVYHPALQQQLIEAAEQAGATVLRGTELVAIERRSDDFTVTVRDEGGIREYRPPVVIAADGSGSATAKSFGIQRQRDPDTTWLVGWRVSGHQLDPSATHAVEIDGGVSFIFPQADNFARVYAVLRAEQMAPIRRDQTGATFLATVAPVMPGLDAEGTTSAGPQGVFGNADSWTVKHDIPGLLVIGDAASSNDPTQGHGISLSFRDASELKTAIAGSGPDPEMLRALQLRIRQYRQTMRITAQWMARLWMTVGPEADARRERYGMARESDPEAGGYARLLVNGPGELVPDAAAERRFFEGLDAV